MRTLWISIIFFLLASLAEADINVSFDKDSYTDDNSLAVITVTDPNANTDPNSIQEVTLEVKSTADSSGISISAEEADFNTGEFVVEIGFTTDMSDDEQKLIQVENEDEITVTYQNNWTDEAEIDFADPNEPEESTSNDETPSSSSASDPHGFTFGKEKGCFIDTTAACVKDLFH